jgi:hypothetical protein
VRYFSDGLALGGKDFLEKIFQHSSVDIYQHILCQKCHIEVKTLKCILFVCPQIPFDLAPLSAVPAGSQENVAECG